MQALAQRLHAARADGVKLGLQFLDAGALEAFSSAKPSHELILQLAPIFSGAALYKTTGCVDWA